MDKQTKKTLLIVGIVEAIVLIFCLTISIIVLSTITEAAQTNLEKNGLFIGTLQNTPVLFFCTIVLPLFVIFVVDGVYLVVYSTKKQSMVSQEEKDAIQEEARRQAREEVLKELNAQKDSAKKDDKK